MRNQGYNRQDADLQLHLSTGCRTRQGTPLVASGLVRSAKCSGSAVHSGRFPTTEGLVRSGTVRSAIAHRLALGGGLKHIEQEMGIDRHTTISGLDGLDAVRLWFQCRRDDTTARDTLLSYNRADTENIVFLADRFYKNLVFRFGLSSLSTTLQPASCQ